MSRGLAVMVATLLWLAPSAGLVAQEAPDGGDVRPAGAKERPGKKRERAGRSNSTRFGGKKPHEMTEAELEEAGYLWEPESEHGPSLVGGLVAAVPGSIVHGMGHYFVRNSQAGQDLLLLEVGAVGALGGSALLYGLVEDRNSFWGETGLLALQIGGALYSVSWVADIIGVSKGTESEMPRLSKRIDGVIAQGGYTFLLADDLPCNSASPCQALDVGLEEHLGNVVLHPYARLAMFPYDQYPFDQYDELGMDVLWQAVPGQTPQEYFGFGLSLSSVSFTGVRETAPQTPGGGGNNSVTRLEFALADLSLDLEVLLQHLHNVVVQSSAGIGIGFNSGERAAVPGDNRSPYVFLRQSFLFNLTPAVMMRPYYVFSEAEAVGRTSEWLGAFGCEAVWTPLPDWDVYVDGRGGDGVMISSGVRYNIWD